MARKAPGIPFSVWAALSTVAGVSVATRLIQGQPILRGSRAGLDLDALFAEVERRSRVPTGTPGLTILSNGLGRDSATIVALLVEGKLKVDGRVVRPKDVDAVVFSDTGYEWGFSYQVIPTLTKMLEDAGVPFYVLRKPPSINQDYVKQRRYTPQQRARVQAAPPSKWEGWITDQEAAFAKAWAATLSPLSRAELTADLLDAEGTWAGRPARTRQLKSLSSKAFAALVRKAGIPTERGKPNDPAFKKIMKQNRRPPPWLKEEWNSLADKAALGGYHRTAPLVEHFSAFRRMNMRSSPECTDRHKIQPINHFIEDLTQAKYGVDLAEWGKRVLRGEAQPHRVLIGFAADEAERVERGGRAILTRFLVRPTRGKAGEQRPQLLAKGFVPSEEVSGMYEYRSQIDQIQEVERFLDDLGLRRMPWLKGHKSTLNTGAYRLKLGKVWKRELYPLHEAGITKADEGPILKRAGLNWIRKSGCFVCHFQPLEWFAVLKIINPDVYADVVAYEARARERNPKWFLRGNKPLDLQVSEWWLKHPKANTPAWPNKKSPIHQILDKNYDRCGAFNLAGPHLPVTIPA